MINYIGRRLLILPLVLFGVTLLIFGMIQLLSPYQRLSAYVADPTKLMYGDPDELVEMYGLNDPLYKQYARWLNNLFHGDLGWSQSASMPVTQAILRYLPATLELVLFSIIPVILGGIWLGTISAVRHNRLTDHLLRVTAVIGWSLPTFVAGLFLLMIFYGLVDWLPPGRLSLEATRVVEVPGFIRLTGLNTIDSLINGQFKVFLDALRHLIAPVITLAYVQWALILRIMRSSMLETLCLEYVTTARAKGLRERVVIKKHARRNALIPVATVSGWLLVGMLGGVVIVETVFNYKGLGWWAANSAKQLDFASLLGYTLFNSIVLVVMNLLVDVLYSYIDPRIRLT